MLKRKLLAPLLLLCCVVAAHAQAAKTHVVDVIHDAGGNPLSGKITFFMTQPSADVPDGLVVKVPSVSATLDVNGGFSVYLYPSTSCSPTCYYDVKANVGGAETDLGVYNIPSSASIVTLGPNKVVNANLAAQYTLASQSAVLAMAANISSAALAQLTFASIVSKLGYTPVAPASLGTMAGQDRNAVNITGGTVTGITCVGCTNITPGSSNGGIANNGNTTIAAGVGGSGGRVSVQTHGGLERIGVEDDGTVTIPKLVVPIAVPSTWQVSKYAGNPITAATGGDLAYENYVPSAVHVGSDTWVYTKGNTSIYACKMTNGVPPCVPQGAVLSPGPSAWDASNVINPYAVIDGANSLIHIYYSGRNSAGIEQVGHATCPAATPKVCTKDPANPVITVAQAQTALGIPTARIVNITAAAKIGGVLTFYGYATDFNIDHQPGTVWKIFRATGTFGAPVIAGAVAGFPANTTRLTIIYDVFQLPGWSQYAAVYRDSGYQIDNSAATWAGQFLAVTDDGQNFSRVEPLGAFIQPTAAATGFDVRGVHTSHVEKDPSDTNFLRPLVDSNNFEHWFYSGIDEAGLKTQGGLAYVRPGVGGSPPVLRFDGTPSNRPIIEIDNPAGNLGFGRIYGYGDALGTDMILTSGIGRDLLGNSAQSDPSSGSALLAVSGRAQTVTFSLAPPGAGASLPATFQVIVGGVLIHPVTVATLPSSPAAGTCSWVTDSLTSTFFDVVAGGGSFGVLACFDGGQWRVH